MTDLSIIVVTWNTRDLVLDCLASIERVGGSCGAGYVVETLVVDNGSEDGTAQAVRSGFPDVRLVKLSANLGFSAGCNAGIREASGRVLLLLNSDARLCAGVLERCMGFLEAHPDVAIVGPQLLNPDGSKQNSVHNFPILATEFIPKSVLQFVFRKRFPSRRWTDSEPVDVEALVGAAMFVRRDVIDTVGELSEDYFFFLEETDWCWRMRAAGWRVVHLPDANVTHLSGASSKKKNPSLTRIEYHRSLYCFYRKHRGMGWMATVLVLRTIKALFYVVTQAPMALADERRLARWKSHRGVLVWHLRGCPESTGLARLSAADRARMSAAN
ncbi:MAG: glycosyltransferase family 2 protein [Myxococcota bacterium]